MAAQGTGSVGEQMGSMASQAKEKISEVGRTATDKIDENRGTIAGGLESAGSSLHEKADALPGGEKVTRIAHTAADKLTTTADYVRQHDVNSMMADVQELVKKNPGPALAAAAVAGFLVARAFSGRD